MMAESDIELNIYLDQIDFNAAAKLVLVEVTNFEVTYSNTPAKATNHYPQC